ncbi:MAG TPA: deiodinase-like protein [Gaiellaceae bacterium]|nr:deiodinase-like protein [Gaiellaceae bacterium]
MERIAARFDDRVSFLVVYIREAHPEEGWILPENRRSGIAVNEPTTIGERRAVAQTCAAKLELTIPAVIDEIDNAVASAYGGWPDRLYLIGTDGRIAFQGGEGPFGFKPAALEQAIEQLV